MAAGEGRGPGPEFDAVLEFEPGDAVHLGGQEAEFVEIRVRSRTAADDLHDGNWLRCEVELAVGGFEARFPADLRTDALQRWHGEVAALYESLAGEARFESMEGQLRLTLTGDGRGHIRLDGTARDRPGSDNALDFRLDFDQTQLFGAVAQLDELLRRFTVRGEPRLDGRRLGG